MHETSDLFYFIITFSCTKYFVHSYSVDVVFTLYYRSINLDNGLQPSRRQAIIRTNADPIHWRIYAALGGEELISQKVLF